MFRVSFSIISKFSLAWVFGTMIFGLSPVHALDPALKPTDYIVSHWDTENGLPHNSVRSICQTHDGYLWIGTGLGIARFDGLRFTVFNRYNTPELSGNQVGGLAETADGSLWIATSNALVRYFEGKFTAYTREHGLRTISITSVCTIDNGRQLLVAGRGGASRWEAGQFTRDEQISKIDLAGLRVISVDHNRNIWLPVGATAVRHKDGVSTVFGVEAGLTTQVISVGEDAKGQVVAATQNGLMRLEGEKFVPFESNAQLSSPSLNRVLADSSGNLWIGSVAGLDRYVNDKVLPYILQNGRKLGVVDALLEDREGCLWIGTSEGLYRLVNRRAATLSQADGISGNLIGGILRTRDDSLWISSWGNGIDRLKDGVVVQHYGLGAPLSHNTITLLYEAPDGSMWLGNRGSSIDHLVGDKVTTYVLQNGVATSRPVKSAMMDDDGTMLVGISNRGLLQIRNEQFIPVPEAEPMAKATIFTFLRTKEGRLMVGTNLGVFERAADRTWHLHAFPGFIEAVFVRGILADEQSGGYWLATEGYGLVRWEKENEARSYGSQKGMIDDILFSVVEDEFGALWVTSQRGIARIRKSEFPDFDQGHSAKLNVMSFGRADGLFSGSTPGVGDPASIRLPDGRLMFATPRGVAVIDPRSVQANSRPPDVVIESVVADERLLPVTSPISLAAGTSKVEIQYTALSLVVPERLRFRYKLDGSDPRWVEAEHDRVAHYTHLAPGHYVFHVLACNNDGVWNETGASLAFTLLPHYYQTLWFRLTAIGMLLAAIGGVFWARLRQYKERQREMKQANAVLDQRVQERTAELSRSNEELRQRELLFRLIFEHAPVGISWKRTDLGNHYHFNPTFRRILNLSVETSPDYNFLAALVHPEDAPRQEEMNQRIRSGKEDSYIIEERFALSDGRLIWGLLAVAVVRDSTGLIIQDISILEDITARKQAEQELVTTYDSLVDASRLAGMAEVATGVLHNVGNVLNSVNVSSSLIAGGMRALKVDAFNKVMAMFREHAADLGQFLIQDPKGKRLPEFLESLAKNFAEERLHLLQEIESMQRNIDHIKEIVVMHEAYTVPVTVSERLDLGLLVEDALRMNSEMFLSQDITVVREFEAVPLVLAEKGKVLQILTHLLRNAKRACDDAPVEDKVVKVVRIQIQTLVTGTVRVQVTDNGVGIAAENLVKIFNHGFTTSKDGHGFGLHASANAAREMKGSLLAESAGEGKGATFILELPTVPPGTTARPFPISAVATS